MPTLTLAELSSTLGEPFEGDGSVEIFGVAEINTAKSGEISFVANPKYVSLIPHSKASALIVPVDLQTDFLPIIRSNNPYLTFTKALTLFHQNQRRVAGGVHPSSHVAEDVNLGSEVSIMPHAVIESGAVIGNRVIIYPGVYVGKNAVIGDEVTIYSNVTIYDGCHIGNRTILHAGCRIGITGVENAICGVAPVELGNDIELGANVVVSGDDRSPTRIGEGTKIDNLVQIGKGASIGAHCIIVAQVTIGDHVTLDERVTVAGQVVISPNISIGARSRIGAKSVVETDVPVDADYWGVPAQPLLDEKRLKVNLARLPRLFEKLREIEEKQEKG